MESIQTKFKSPIHQTGQCYVFISRQLDRKGLVPPKKTLCHFDAIGKTNTSTDLGIRLSSSSSVLYKTQPKRGHYDHKNSKMPFLY